MIDLGNLLGPGIAAIVAAVAAKGIHDVKKEVQTNHGRRHGEYVEEIAENVAAVAADVRFLRVETRADTKRVMSALADHSVQDADRFSQLEDMLTAQNVKSAERAETI